MINREWVQAPEAEKEIETKIVMQFMRHGKREKGATIEEDASYDLRLTPDGRKQMNDRGKELDAQPEVSLGWGSPRVRTQESAYQAMLANEGITTEDSFEDIEEKIAEEQKVGKKMIADDRLNFIGGGPIEPEMNAAYHAGKYLQYILNQSDERAIITEDKNTSTYTRMAANIAEIVKRYVEIGNNFNRVAGKSDGKYEEFGNQLERYLGTHQGNSETFVAKVLEKVSGIEKKEEFAEAAGGGFKEGGGVKIEIINTGKDQKIIMYYKIGEKEESVTFDKKILDEIIEDRNILEKRVEDQIKFNRAKDPERFMHGDGEVSED